MKRTSWRNVHLKCAGFEGQKLMWLARPTISYQFHGTGMPKITRMFFCLFLLRHAGIRCT